MATFIFFLVFVGIAAGLAWYLIFHDRGEREPVGALWLAAGFGLMGAFLALLLERELLGIHTGVPPKDMTKLAITTLGIGVIEEACKFLPLAVYIYRKRYFNENTDGVVYFALAGLGFGLPENLLYTAQFGSTAGFARLILTPFFHAATTAIIGYYLAKGKMAGKSVLWAAVPLVFMMAVHALYDFGLMSEREPLALMSLLITFSLSGAIFYLFIKSREKDEDEGISAVGHNSFCRSCGCPNPKHHLYCIQCGNNA